MSAFRLDFHTSKKNIEPWGRRWKTLMSVYIAITEIFQKEHNQHPENKKQKRVLLSLYPNI
jgi:hypothetical protein